MINLSASQKPLFEMAQSMVQTMEKMTQANLQMANTIANTANTTATAILKTGVESFVTCCKLGEETTQQATKTATSSTGKN